jgi:hypothetical protein
MWNFIQPANAPEHKESDKSSDETFALSIADAVNGNMAVLIKCVLSFGIAWTIGKALH